jgi:uncharacterized tellurite resistance protein B-like protein
MLDALRRFVSSRAPAEPAAPGPDPLHVAACALLLELAHADGEFSDSERSHIRQAMMRHFGLDERLTTDLMALAESQRGRSIDHFQFTREINAQYDLGQKLVLAEVMWGVVLADGTVAEHEAYLVRKMANLLDLEPGYLAQARRSASGSGDAR